jgi:hypothetical protein
MAEGVGFEPTVGCPTLDFESSALNRTQPPFLIAQDHLTTTDRELASELIREAVSFPYSCLAIADPPQLSGPPLSLQRQSIARLTILGVAAGRIRATSKR